jgi:hypothetical protein
MIWNTPSRHIRGGGGGGEALFASEDVAERMSRILRQREARAHTHTHTRACPPPAHAHTWSNRYNCRDIVQSSFCHPIKCAECKKKGGRETLAFPVEALSRRRRRRKKYLRALEGLLERRQKTRPRQNEEKEVEEGSTRKCMTRSQMVFGRKQRLTPPHPSSSSG